MSQENNQNNSSTEPAVTFPAANEVVRNPNERANENIRVRTAEAETKSDDVSEKINSEITDGEDA